MRHIVYCVLFLLLMTNALGFGISPAKNTVTANEPTFALTPIYHAGETGAFTVHVEGTLADYITITVADKIYGTFTPRPAIPPGVHEQQIILRLTSEETAGTVAARAEVASLLYVKIPYPEQYLDAAWSLAFDHGSQHILTTVMLENLGSAVVTPDDIQITLDTATLHLAPVPVAPGTYEKVTGRYTGIATGALSLGEYLATLTIPYGDREFTATQSVTIGTPLLTLTNITYEPGPITPIDVHGAIVWNTPLTGVFTVRSQNTTILEETTTLDGTFTHRLYVEDAPAEMTVSVTVGETTVTRTITVAQPVSKPRTWYILFIATLVILLWLFVKVRNIYKEE